MGRSARRRGEQLDRAGAERPRELDLRGGEGAGDRRQAQSERGGDDLGDHGGAHHEPGTGIGGAADLVGREHRAGADERSGLRGAAHRVERAGGVQRDLEHLDATGHQGREDRVQLGRLVEPDDGQDVAPVEGCLVARGNLPRPGRSPRPGIVPPRCLDSPRGRSVASGPIVRKVSFELGGIAHEPGPDVRRRNPQPAPGHQRAHGAGERPSRRPGVPRPDRPRDGVVQAHRVPGARRPAPRQAGA